MDYLVLCSSCGAYVNGCYEHIIDGRAYCSVCARGSSSGEETS